MEKIIIYTDGGARGNPGPAGIGAVVMDGEGKVLKEISQYIGKATNNFAEYEALIRAFELITRLYGAKLRDMEIDVRMDSELVVRQLSGQYKVKEPGLKGQFARIGMLRMSEMPNILFSHVPREKNAHADKLVNKAIDAAIDEASK
ncbi:ribonuclease HI family protein [Acetobacteraceae bacterium]|nr:ribonuclease HI family protein [Candidatus Parcubacteria bacterium]